MIDRLKNWIKANYSYLIPIIIGSIFFWDIVTRVSQLIFLIILTAFISITLYKYAIKYLENDNYFNKVFKGKDKIINGNEQLGYSIFNAALYMGCVIISSASILGAYFYYFRPTDF